MRKAAFSASTRAGNCWNVTIKSNPNEVMNSTRLPDRFRPRPRRLRLAWVLLVLLPFWSMPALGDQEGDFEFQIDGAGAVITRYLGPGGAVVIPDHLGGRPVTSVGDSAFGENTSLTSITIPNSVTSIGETAFIGCTSLTNIMVDILNLNYRGAGGVLFNKDQSTLIAYPVGKTGPYTIFPTG